jgi:hypothetical protein
MLVPQRVASDNPSFSSALPQKLEATVMKFLKQSLDTITLKELEKRLKKKGFMKKKDQYKDRDAACMCAGVPKLHDIYVRDLS